MAVADTTPPGTTPPASPAVAPTIAPTIAPRAVAQLANPAAFLAFARWAVPIAGGLAALLLAWGLGLGWTAPADYQQGLTVRILFVHVPAAWLAMLAYGAMVAGALGTLVWRHPLAEVSMRAAAPIGATFTAIALVTGALWGKPTWGTYWVWDARLTSFLLLLVIYLGLIALGRSLGERGGRALAVLVLVGSVNLPIIKFSVEWWNTLHQPASVMRVCEGAGTAFGLSAALVALGAVAMIRLPRLGLGVVVLGILGVYSASFRTCGTALDPAYLAPLALCALGLTALFAALHVGAMRVEVLRRRAGGLRRRLARRVA